MLLDHTFTAVRHSAGSHVLQSHTCRRGDRQVRQRRGAGVRCYVSSLRPKQPSTHTHTHSLIPTSLPPPANCSHHPPLLRHSLCYKKISEWRRSFEVKAIWMIFVNDAGARSLMGGRSNPEEKTAMLRAQLGALPPFTDFQLKLW